MRFTAFHKDFFGANNGSFSRVTQRENYDSQITLTDFEAELVTDHFGMDNIVIGNVGSNPQLAKKQFLLYPSLEPIELNLVFPKPEKPELRLYLSEKRGFKPQSDEIWFLYQETSGNLVIGSMDESDWEQIGQLDDQDEVYLQGVAKEVPTIESVEQLELVGRIEQRQEGGRAIYVRDPRVAALRLKYAGYTCENDPSHTTFIASSTGKPYVEAHHFVPMKFQYLYETPLDSTDNIVALCPNCHRGIHHATAEHKEEMIKKLYYKRPELQSFVLNDILVLYNCLKNEEGTA